MIGILLTFPLSCHKTLVIALKKGIGYCRYHLLCEKEMIFTVNHPLLHFFFPPNLLSFTHLEIVHLYQFSDNIASLFSYKLCEDTMPFI